MPYLQVALDVPMPQLFDYWADDVWLDNQGVIGYRVLVPFGRREQMGVVIGCSDITDIDNSKIKSILRIFRDIRPLSLEWIDFVRFAARYYQYPLGPAVMFSLPIRFKAPQAWHPLEWESLSWNKESDDLFSPRPSMEGVESASPAPVVSDLSVSGKKSRGRTKSAGVDRYWTQSKKMLQGGRCWGYQLPALSSPRTSGQYAVEQGLSQGYIIRNSPSAIQMLGAHTLNSEQQQVLDTIRERIVRPDTSTSLRPILLHGITGSGKTEVYLNAVFQVLKQGLQVLWLVPEINLTPHLVRQIQERFPASTVVALHSEIKDKERSGAWLLAHQGVADIVVGTRLAVFASIPRLGLLVVDEEHDTSFKQQNDMRYSARDLAVYLAHQRNILVILGSATPSLESYMRAKEGRYQSLSLSERAVPEARIPRIELIDPRNTKIREQTPLRGGMASPLWEALEKCLSQGLQSLVFLNRRGYAPVLFCSACDWKSQCQRCSTYLVIHRKKPAKTKTLDLLAGQNNGLLLCHHCGYQTATPPCCPECGELDLRTQGRGTQRLEKELAEALPQARLLRIDRDTVGPQNKMESLLTQAHDASVDILVGTQMISKGHDFKRIGLVIALEVDSVLFSPSFRASEHLFAQLLQVAGRAGRGESPGHVLVQTRYPQHPLFSALVAGDYTRFAEATLKERKVAGLPPWAYQAVLRALAPDLSVAIEFLKEVAGRIGDRIIVYDPVPMVISKINRVYRAQLVLESPSRPVLQEVLTELRGELYAKPPRLVKWYIEVDPLDI